MTILLRVKNSTAFAQTTNLITSNGGSRGHGVVEGLVWEGGCRAMGCDDPSIPSYRPHDPCM